MNIKLRFFASLRESLELSEMDLTVPPDVKTIAQLRNYLMNIDALWADTLALKKPIRVAQHQTMVEPDTLLEEGAEVAFFPPVTGG
ncbi:molybdopterin converting factor subunit 1 [Polynucleobacter kasalickyi]|uniref:Molybdopterin synthase subunit MoaD n=1 Tax=Polynucleobacter kasalickyi TaxID=1938817 RepID=A0A1W1Y7G5_9BURK|nr:molybdopterin converting factor subunit 1 [Polynucleobacter kasalickyi]SMC32097.1 molybdopterin synthase subunit MoaD [Polynucleobacter kasalickyi]